MIKQRGDSVKLRDISMFAKMTIAFIIFVLLPIMIVLLFTYAQWRDNARGELVGEQWRRIDQVKEAIGMRIDQIETISNNIASDPQLIYLLNRSYIRDRYSFDQYRTQAQSPVLQALMSNATSIWRIRVFFNNPTIPEGWGSFYSTRRTSDQEWYKRCMEEGAPFWFRANGKEYFTHHDLSNTISENCYIFARPVKDLYGNILGVLCIEVKDSSLFEPFELSIRNEGFFIQQNLTVILGNVIGEDVVEDEDAIRIFSDDNGRKENSFRKSFLLYDEILPISAYLGVVLDMEAYASLSRPLAVNFITMFCAICAAMLVFYLAMSSMTRKINDNLRIITSAVQGDLSLRVPVRGNDEIGQIARHFNSLIELVDNLIRDRVKKETAQKEAQLNDLQYRINPHFFYNTLDILAGSMVLVGQFHIAEAVSDFGKMLRYNLHGGLTGTLVQEMQYIRSYMQIQDLRYEHRVHLHIDLPEALEKREIIKFILQPIVENCVMHGFQDEELNITINITENADNSLTIVICDDGKGIEQSQLRQINNNLLLSGDREENKLGIGLGNISERIKLYYGEGAVITMRSQPGVHTHVTMVLPQGQQKGETR